jgi:hypothetical protein
MYVGYVEIGFLKKPRKLTCVFLNVRNFGQAKLASVLTCFEKLKNGTLLNELEK